MSIYAEFHSLVDQFRNQNREMNKRIEALEENYRYHQGWLIGHTKDIRALLKERFPFLETKDPFPYDRHGKPPGGLEKWDVVSYIFKDESSEHHGKKVFGQYCKADIDIIWAYWQNLESGEIENGQQWMEKDRVTFEFRPKPEKS